MDKINQQIHSVARMPEKGEFIREKLLRGSIKVVGVTKIVFGE